MPDLMEILTERQRAAWPEAVQDIRAYTYQDVPHDLNDYSWMVHFDDEVRPGRGRRLSAIWCDGYNFAQVLMDVYGYPSVSVAELTWLHNSEDDECECEPCARLRDEE